MNKDKKNNTNNNLNDSIEIQSIVPDRTKDGIIICPDVWEDGWK